VTTLPAPDELQVAGSPLLEVEAVEAVEVDVGKLAGGASMGLTGSPLATGLHPAKNPTELAMHSFAHTQ